MIIEIDSEAQFKEEATRGKVLVDFWAPWCGPCRVMTTALEEIESRVDNSLIKVNVDLFPQIAKEFGVRGIPALFVLQDGKIEESVVGSKKPDELIALLE